MNDGVYLGPYIARKKLVLPQGPGKKGLLRLAPNDVFSFDGDEPIDILKLLRDQKMQPYTKPLEDLE